MENIYSQPSFSWRSVKEFRRRSIYCRSSYTIMYIGRWKACNDGTKARKKQTNGEQIGSIRTVPVDDPQLDALRSTAGVVERRLPADLPATSSLNSHTPADPCCPATGPPVATHSFRIPPSAAAGGPRSRPVSTTRSTPNDGSGQHRQRASRAGRTDTAESVGVDRATRRKRAGPHKREPSKDQRRVGNGRSRAITVVGTPAGWAATQSVSGSISRRGN